MQSHVSSQTQSASVKNVVTMIRLPSFIWMIQLINQKHCWMHGSAAQCQFFKFYSISDLSNLFFDIIGLAQTSQEYHQKFLRTAKNYNFCINFIKMLSNILKIKLIFGDFVIQCRLSMSFDAGLSIAREWFLMSIRYIEMLCSTNAWACVI